MRPALLILALMTMLVLAADALGRSPAVRGESKVRPKCECLCPTLETLLAEKAAKDNQDRYDLAAKRRQIIKDKLSELVGK